MSRFDTLFGRIKNSLQETMRDIILDLSTGNADRDMVAGKVSVKSLQLDTAGTIEVEQGEFAWNSDEECFDFGMNGATWQGGLENFYQVRNNTGSIITDGTVVMADGTVGASGRILVTPMDGSSTLNAKFLMGLTTFDLGTDGDTKDGKITWFGKVRGLDTTGTLSFDGLETWVDGEVLYVDPDHLGKLTNVEPEPPAINMPICFVVFAHAEMGTLNVRITPIDEAFLKTSPVCLSTYSATPDRNAEENIHGDLDLLVSAQDVNAGDITLTADTDMGLSKLVIVNNGGGETGAITVTGTSVDRDTGAETALDTSTITVDTTTTDATAADANSIDVHSLTNAYITDKWFTGTANVVISQDSGSLTDIDVYQCSFEQFNDSRSVLLKTVDLNIFCLTGDVNAKLSIHAYTVEVTGDKVDIISVADVVRTGDFVSDKWYRFRRQSIDVQLDGRTDGIFINLALLGSPAKFRDAGLKIWADVIP